MFKGQGRSLPVFGVLLVALVLALALAGLRLGTVRAANLTVTTTADTIDAAVDCASVTVAALPGTDGVTSLREAICAANANAGSDTINFNIDNTTFGAAPHVINVASALPNITDTVTINGLSEPDISAGTCPLPGGALAIQLNEPGTFGDGLHIVAGGSGSTIRGLSITNFTDDAIQLESSNGNSITCNYLGVAADGTTSGGNTYGVTTDGSSTNNTIGGAAAGDGNVIANQGSLGLFISSSGNTVRGNIVRNNTNGIRINGSNSTVQNNAIYNQSQDGVLVTAGTGNRITQNSIYDNGSTAAHLGIDLSPVGESLGGIVTPNDLNDGDSGVNNVQNFPVLDVAITNGSTTTVTGSLNSVGSGATYTVELFSNTSCDASGNGEGRTYLGNATVTISSGNTISFTAAGLAATTVGQFVTATATDANGNTSEFSACATIAADSTQTGSTLTVNSTNDPGTGACTVVECTLREAITLANSTTSTDETINFNIPGAGPHTITPATPLPDILDTAYLDGLSQPANGGSSASCTTGPLLINITAPTGTVASGMRFGAGSDGSTVRGFAVSGYNGNFFSAGIVAFATSNITIQCNFVGTNAAGTAEANGGNNLGIRVNTSTNVLVGTNGDGTNDANERNLASGNNIGIYFDTSSGSKAAGNYVGTDVTGINPLPNDNGIAVGFTANNSIIGYDGSGTAATEANVVRFNNDSGVSIFAPDSTGNRVSANRIDSNGASNQLGIDLANGAGPNLLTANDTGDEDSGANNLQNFPVLTLATPAGVVHGSLDSLATNTAYPVRIEFFANTACDSSGYGEGEAYLGATSIAAPGAFSTALTLVSGKDYITATAIDNNGNTSEFSACQPVDSTPPDTTIDTNPSNPSASASASFTFHGDDGSGSGVASFQCKLDSGDFATCTSAQTYNNLSDGSHTFQVRAIDAAGNTDPTPATYTWRIDTTSPTVTINQASGQADPTGASTINFTAIFNEPVTGFGAGDVQLSGTAGATTFVITEVAPDNGTTYNVAVSGMTTSGTVIVSIPSGSVIDAASNPNIASTSTDNTVTFTIGTQLDNVSGTTTYGDTTATLTARLRNLGTNAPIAGQTIVFTLAGQPVCGGSTGRTCPVTNAQGVAALTGVPVTKRNAGTYPNLVCATFAAANGYIGTGPTCGPLVVARRILYVKPTDRTVGLKQPNPPTIPPAGCAAATGPSACWLELTNGSTFVPGDTWASLNLTNLRFQYSRNPAATNATEQVGSAYRITVLGATSTNYELRFQQGTLTVK